MGDANPIRILGDYFKPSHEGYRNTIELPVGNNVFFSTRRTAKLRNDILMFQQHQGESLSEMAIDYAVGERLRKLRPKEAWATIVKLAQYKDEGWKDLVDPNEGSLDHQNPNIKQLLGIMKRKVDTLINGVISLTRKGESVFRMTTNKLN
nr:hypothetical protein [Tanacetum cinerariifolium]